MPDTAPGRADARPFAEFLHEHRQGGLNHDLGDALMQVTEAVTMTGKRGEFQLNVTVRPAGRAGEMVIVADAIKLKLPQADHEESVFFIDRQGNLTRRNPNQPELPFLREVDGETGEIQEVSK